MNSANLSCLISATFAIIYVTCKTRALKKASHAKFIKSAIRLNDPVTPINMITHDVQPCILFTTLEAEIPITLKENDAISWICVNDIICDMHRVDKKQHYASIENAVVTIDIDDHTELRVVTDIDYHTKIKQVNVNDHNVTLDLNNLLSQFKTLSSFDEFCHSIQNNNDPTLTGRLYLRRGIENDESVYMIVGNCNRSNFLVDNNLIVKRVSEGALVHSDDWISKATLVAQQPSLCGAKHEVTAPEIYDRQIRTIIKDAKWLAKANNYAANVSLLISGVFLALCCNLAN